MKDYCIYDDFFNQLGITHEEKDVLIKYLEALAELSINFINEKRKIENE